MNQSPITRAKRSGSSNVALSSFVFGATTLTSRVFGMLRDMVVAFFFGAGVDADAFYVAFRFVNLFRAFFAEGAFTQAFVPNLSQVAEQEPEQERLFVGTMLLVLGGCLLVLVVLFELVSTWVVSWYAFGYRDNPTQLALVGELLQITMPYALLISFAALLSCVLQTHQRFFISGFSPVLLNLCMIVAAVFATQLFAVPIHALGWATLLAGVIQLAMPLVQVMRAGLTPAFSLSYRHPAIKKTILMFGPVVLSASVTQIAMLIDTLLATFLEVGSVTWLYIANRLIGFPLGIFGISIAVVVLPVLARAHASGNRQLPITIFGWATHTISVIAIPASCALVVVPEAIVITLFHYGSYTLTDSVNAAMALRFYALGLFGMMMMKILINQFLAVGDAKTPLFVAMITTILGVIASLILMQFMEFAGIALSTGLASLTNAALLYSIALRRGLISWYPTCVRAGVRILFASLVMLLVCLWLFDDPQVWGGYELIERVIRLASYIAIACLSYALVMLAFGWRLRLLRSPC